MPPLGGILAHLPTTRLLAFRRTQSEVSPWRNPHGTGRSGADGRQWDARAQIVLSWIVTSGAPGCTTERKLRFVVVRRPVCRRLVQPNSRLEGSAVPISRGFRLAVILDAGWAELLRRSVRA